MIPFFVIKCLIGILWLRIQKLIIKLAKEGKAVIFISSEIEEMLRTCDRMVVLRDGVKVGEIDDEMTQNSIMKAIAGGDKDE